MKKSKIIKTDNIVAGAVLTGIGAVSLYLYKNYESEVINRYRSGIGYLVYEAAGKDAEEVVYNYLNSISMIHPLRLETIILEIESTGSMYRRYKNSSTKEKFVNDIFNIINKYNTTVANNYKEKLN